jgi:hypothetical protein
MLDVVWLTLVAVRAACRQRGDLVAENLLLRPQLAVLTRPTRRRPCVRFRRLDKPLRGLIRRLRPDWRRHLVVVTPETVVGWHRAGWRRYRRWQSRTPAGRPRLSPEGRARIARLSKEDPLWGTERIRGERLELGIAVSNRSIRRYRWRGPTRPPHRPGQTWGTFLRNHAHAIWAADLFTVQTLMRLTTRHGLSGTPGVASSAVGCPSRSPGAPGGRQGCSAGRRALSGGRWHAD